MRHTVLVGTHQKTGTVWMDKVFRSIAKAMSTPYYNVSRKNNALFSKTADKLEKSNQNCIIFHNHSAFPKCCFTLRSKGFRLIRDPRDVVISAVKYHETTDAQFANMPKKNFGNMSLRHKICSLETLEDKILFEINEVMEKNILDMLHYSFSDQILTLKYEHLISDGKLVLTSKLLQWLGFDEREIILGLCIFWNESLFGLKKSGSTSHIRNGAPRQFESIYTPKLHDAFEKKYPGVIQQLRYDDPQDEAPHLPELPQCSPVLRAAEILHTQRNHDAITQALDLASDICDDPSWPHASYVRYLLHIENFKHAELHGWRAIDKNDLSPDALLEVGNIFFALGDYESARSFFGASLSLLDSDKTAVLYTQSLILSNKPEKAKSFLATSLSKSPDRTLLLKFYNKNFGA
jgi:tetratricopeptide (TPR) repeat protein